MASGGFNPSILKNEETGDVRRPRHNQLPTTTVELTVRCCDLSKEDLLSKSDPMCVLFLRSDAQWVEVARTERLTNTQEPSWSGKFTLDYSFEERQPLKFEVYDCDSESTDLGAHDLLGVCETSLGHVVSSPCKQFASVLKKNGGSGGKIFVNVEEVSICCTRLRDFLRNKLPLWNHATLYHIFALA